MKKEDNDILDDLFGEVTYAYTRAQALEDGFLVDVSAMAKEAGFKWPVAMTRTLYEDSVTWDNDSEKTHQDESGRLWDVIYMAYHGIKSAKVNGTELIFEYLRVPRGEIEAVETKVKLVSGPGDSMEPVITLMLPEED